MYLDNDLDHQVMISIDRLLFNENYWSSDLV